MLALLETYPIPNALSVSRTHLPSLNIQIAEKNSIAETGISATRPSVNDFFLSMEQFLTTLLRNAFFPVNVQKDTFL